VKLVMRGWLSELGEYALVESLLLWIVTGLLSAEVIVQLLVLSLKYKRGTRFLLGRAIVKSS
jgi:hypothetical protein